jgi:hypothetical protein
VAKDTGKVRALYAKCPNVEGEQFGAEPHWLLADLTAKTIDTCRRNAPIKVTVREHLKLGMVTNGELDQGWTEKEPDPC